MRWLDSIIDSMDMELEQTPGESEGQGSHVAVHGVTKNQTRLSNQTTTTESHDPLVDRKSRVCLFMPICQTRRLGLREVRQDNYSLTARKGWKKVLMEPRPPQFRALITGPSSSCLWVHMSVTRLAASRAS